MSKDAAAPPWSAIRRKLKEIIPTIVHGFLLGGPVCLENCPEQELESAQQPTINPRQGSRPALLCGLPYTADRVTFREYSYTVAERPATK